MKLLMMFIILMAAFPYRAAALINEREIAFYESKARRFLCEKLLCLDEAIPFDIKYDLKYLAFYPSNHKQILFNPNLDRVELQISLVHEYTHVYRSKFNSNETLWLNEGIAKLMEYHYTNVWPVSYSTKLQQKPTIVISNDPKDYGPDGDGYLSSFLLLLYLYNHFGEEKFFKKIMESPLSGWENITKVIKSLNEEGDISIPQNLLNKTSILWNFSVALWLNDAYLAPFSLFFIDSRYSSLKEIFEFPLTPSARRGIKDNIQIFYHPKYFQTDFKAVFALQSYDPLILKKAQPTDSAKTFIYIDY